MLHRLQAADDELRSFLSSPQVQHPQEPSYSLLDHPGTVQLSLNYFLARRRFVLRNMTPVEHSPVNYELFFQLGC